MNARKKKNFSRPYWNVSEKRYPPVLMSFGVEEKNILSECVGVVIAEEVREREKSAG
jgi:hypothetical protein